MIIRSALSNAVSYAVQSMIDAVAAGAGGFNPDSLFGAGDGGGVIDCGNLALCVFQDAAGTVPVTAPGQTVLAVRARNRPTFLMVWDDATLPVTYELDPQGYPALRAALGENTGWAFFRKEDGGIPVNDFSIVLAAMGLYGPGQVGVGTGWTVAGDAGGSDLPYSYSGVYTVITEDAAELTVNLSDAPVGVSVPIAENIDGRPYVFSSRVSDGDSRFQINLEPVHVEDTTIPEAEVPVGIRFWISPGDYWYGGVFITRDLSDPENYDTQVWCGSLAGITLTPPEPFHPLDLFLPGDIGGFISSDRIDTLFQTRAGPNVPVTADGQRVEFITNQKAGGANLSRPLIMRGFDYASGRLRSVMTGSTNGVTGSADNTYQQMTIVSGFAMQEVSGGAPLGFNTFPVQAIVANNAVDSGGASLLAMVRTDLSVRMRLTCIGVADINIPAVPVNSVHVVGARVNSASPTQFLFINENESTPTLEYRPVDLSANNQIWYSSEGPAPGLLYEAFTVGFFYINRELSDTELAQLKQWFRDQLP